MTTKRIPDLVLAAHGTRSAAGVELIYSLANSVAQHGISVHPAFVDVLGPSPSHVLAALAKPAVVVPAFLAAGYHVHTDVPREVAESGHRQVAVAPVLGPDPSLARVQHAQLRAAGWRPGDAVAMAAAGSSDPQALREVRCAARLLARELGTSVPTGFVAAAAPEIAEVVDRFRAAGSRRVFIASYLLAPGMFQKRLLAAGADGVSDPLGGHPAMTELVLDRYRAGRAGLAAAAA